MMKRLIALAMVALLLAAVPAALAQDLKPLMAGEGLALVPYDFTLYLDDETLQQEVLRYNQALKDAGIQTDLIDAEGDDALWMQEQQMTAEDLYQAASYLNFSPDGRQLFGVIQGVPFVYGLETRQLRLIAPAGPVEPEKTATVLHKALRMPNDGGMAWSADGNWLALSNPRLALQMLIPAANILLVDVQAGTVVPVHPPTDAKPTDPGYTGRAPSGVFSADSRTFYYDAFGAREEEEQAVVSQLWARDLATGQVRLLRKLATNKVTADASRLLVEGNFVSSFMDLQRNGFFGLQLSDPQGEDHLMRVPLQDRHTRYFYVQVLGGAGNGRLLVATVPELEPALLSLVETRPPQEEGLQRFLALAPKAPAGDQIRFLGFSDPPAQHLIYPNNGAISQDGNYLLVRAGGGKEEADLYLCSLEEGIVRRVDLAQTGLAHFERLGGQLFAYQGTAQGLRWLEDGTLVLQNGSQSRRFALVTEQP